MSDIQNLSRRQAFKFLSLPLLPLSGLSSIAALAGCGSDAVAPTFKSASFGGMAAPTLANPAAMATTSVGSMLNVALSDGSTVAYKLAYQPFFVTGDMVADGKGGTMLSGGYVDINNKPIMDKSVAGKERQFYSDGPDGTSLLSLSFSAWCSSKASITSFSNTTRSAMSGVT